MLRCRECGGDELSWQPWDIADRNGISGAGGRTVFFLGCDECSATVVHSVSANDVAEALNRYGWRPDDAD